MAKKEKLLKKSRFLKNVSLLKEAVDSSKVSSIKFQYPSREDYVDRIFKIINEKENKEFSRESLLI
jgi:hypothetical protein